MTSAKIAELSVFLLKGDKCMDLIKELLFVGFGGFIGASGRYGISILLLEISKKHNYPYATLTVNILGSFLIGILAVILIDKPLYIKLFLMVGILGGFTTFSSFSHETLILFQNGHFFNAFLHIAANIILCLLGVGAGYLLAKSFI